MSGSSTDPVSNLRAWRRQRLPHGLFLGSALALALGSSLGQEIGWTTLLRVPLAWLGLAVLRLWDDWEDREHDRITHPERVIPEAPVTALIALGLGLLTLHTPAMLVLAVALLLFYRLRPAPWEPVLILKVPALLLLLRGSLDEVAMGAMGLVYGGMLLDSGFRRPGTMLVYSASLALAWPAPLPTGLVLLGVGLALPWVKPARPWVLLAIVLQMLAYELGTP